MDKEVLEMLNKLLSGQERLETDIKYLKTQVTENTRLLKSLEHSAKVSKAEHDKMQNDISHINGNVESIKKDLPQVEIVTANNWADIAKLKAVK